MADKTGNKHKCGSQRNINTNRRKKRSGANTFLDIEGIKHTTTPATSNVLSRKYLLRTGNERIKPLNFEDSGNSCSDNSIHFRVICAFIELKTPTSKGWVKCEECGGNTASWIRLEIQGRMTSEVG